VVAMAYGVDHAPGECAVGEHARCMTLGHLGPSNYQMYNIRIDSQTKLEGRSTHD
jgi:hypothetical protein